MAITFQPGQRNEPAAVSLRDVGLTYPNGVEALRSLSLEVSSGEYMTVVGPSGSGKSSLLRVVAGLEPVTGGSVFLHGEDVAERAPRERDVAMVFQNPALFPHLDVAGNLAFGLRARGASRPEINGRVAEVAGWLGLTGQLGRRPQTLSGGQRQRVALGRAVARRPSVYLLDEPLSALDAPLRSSLAELLRDLHRRLGATILHVTHDQDEALALGDRVAVLQGGRLVGLGTPSDLYERPPTRAVAAFLGTPPVVFLRARLQQVQGEVSLRFDEANARLTPGLSASLPAELDDCGSIEAGIRAEHVRVAATDSIPQADQVAWFDRPARVIRREYRGSEVWLHFALSDGAGMPILARTSTQDLLAVGDTARVGLELLRLTWFRGEEALRSVVGTRARG